MYKKIIPTLLLACGIGFSANAQITAVSATGDGGFETGTTFPANGWTTVNPATAINQWVVATAAGPFAGARCVYISNNAPTNSYQYSNNAARVCHFYRDIVIPAGSVSISLSFQWKGYGQAGLDQMLVYTAPTSVTPVANAPASPSTVITGAALIWTQPTFSNPAYSLATIPLSASLAGTTFRLIFTWQNDASGGISPGAAMDNISVTYNCGAPAAITGNPTLCVGSSSTLADASPGGAWTSSNPAVATVTSTGDVTGIAVGTSKISYTTTCAAPATMIVSVLAVPSVIGGPSSVCLTNNITLTNTALGGAWSSSATTIAPVASVTGVVTGAAVGTATISYSNGCGSPATKTVSVFANPSAITGQDTVCQAGTTTLGNATADAGGTWSAAPTTIATASTSSPTTGLISGIAPGIATITYTSPAGCRVYKTMTVSPLPPPIVGNVPTCVGAAFSITLTNPMPGGAWSSAVPGIANISAGGVLTGIVGGTTTIYYTNGCGSATVVATISPVPTAIVGNDVVCVGANTTLANPVFGGTWSSSLPSIATVLTGSGIVSGISYGTTTITYRMPGGCATTKNVSVVDLPSPIAGPTQVCPDATITLTNPSTGGVWVSLNPSSASVGASSGTVTGITASVATIAYTTPEGCVVYADVTVNPRPGPIVGGTEYCAAEEVALYDPTPGGTWSTLTPATATIGSTTGVMTTSSSGTATIKYTLPTTCSITKSFNIKALPNPVVAFDGPTNTFSTDTTYVNYQWFHSIIGEIPGATLYKTAGMQNGSYFVKVTGVNGCMGVSNPYAYTVAMNVAHAGIESRVRIFPNPANDVVNIDAGKNVRAVISSVDGKTLIEQNNATAINIAGLPNGIYILSVYNDMGIRIAVEKLTKQ